MALQELDDLRITPREMAQRRFPIRIRQGADIEYEVSIPGYAALEAERLERDHERPVGFVADGAVHEVAQVMQPHVRGIDDPVRGVGDGCQQLPLELDGLGQPALFGTQGMLAARFGIAPQQLGIGRLQVHHFAMNAAALEFVEQRGDRGDFLRGIARVEADRGALVTGFITAHGVRHERLEQRGRHVVDAVEAQVLEHVQGNALARAGQATDDDDVHRATLALRPQRCKCARAAPGRTG